MAHHHPTTPSISVTSSSSSTCNSPPQHYSPTALQLFSKPHISLFAAPLSRSPNPPLLRLLSALALAIVFYLGYITGSASLLAPISDLATGPPSTRFPLFRPRLSSAPHDVPFRIQLPSPIPPSPAKIPGYVHYVFGMTPDFGDKPFGFIHYAALQSALQILKPEKIFIHYAYQPTGWWFDRVLEIEQVILMRVRDVKEIYGRPVEHFAHKADIIRLEALRDFGGIYLDLDVFLVRDFTSLLNEQVVLGQEASPQTKLTTPSAKKPTEEILGVCNAVILSRPFAPFISRWLASYRTFDKARWADHSAAVPWALAKRFPDEVTVLGPRAFFYPLWHEDDLWMVHRSLDWSFDNSGQLAYHAWSSLSHKTELAKLDPDRIHVSGGVEQGESSFTFFVRRYIHDDIRNKWTEARTAGEL